MLIITYKYDNFEVICPKCKTENVYLIDDGGDLDCHVCGYPIVVQIDSNSNKFEIEVEG